MEFANGGGGGGGGEKNKNTKSSFLVPSRRSSEFRLEELGNQPEFLRAGGGGGGWGEKKTTVAPKILRLVCLSHPCPIPVYSGTAAREDRLDLQS